MAGQSSERSTLVVIVAATVGLFVLWLGGIFLLWGLLQILGIQADLWAMTEALSTALGAAIVLAAGFLAYRELGEIAANRHLEVADRLFQELNSPENIEARRWVFQNLPPNPREGLASLTTEDRAHIKRVLNSLDHVAFLTQAGWIPEEMVMPWMNPMVVKAWIKLKPYVDYESERRQETSYYKNVRVLGERCIAWRQENLPDPEIVWLDNAL